MPGLAARAVALRQRLAMPSAPSRPPRSAPLPGPALVTKNVMFGACGSCGGAAPAAAVLRRQTSRRDASTSAAKMNIFGLFIAALSLGFSNAEQRETVFLVFGTVALSSTLIQGVDA